MTPVGIREDIGGEPEAGGGTGNHVLAAFMEFFRDNGFILFLVFVAGLGLLVTLKPGLLGPGSVLLAGFAIVAAGLVAFLSSGWRGLVERRRAFLEARAGYEAWMAGDTTDDTGTPDDGSGS